MNILRFGAERTPCIIKIIVCFLFSLFISGNSLAQTGILGKRISLQIEQRTLASVLDEIEAKSGCTFIYNVNLLDADRKVSLSYRNETLEKILLDLLGDVVRKAEIRGNRINLQPGAKGGIKGQVNTSDGEPAAFVTVEIKGLKGTSTDEQGRFSIQHVDEGAYTLSASFVGLQTQEQQVLVAPGETVSATFTLKEDLKTLQEVIIRGGRVNRFSDKETDYVARMPLKNLENPQVYSVINSQLMKMQVATDVQDFLRNATGAAIASYPSGGFSVTTRGFASNVGARNGMEIGTGRSTIDIANLERIEVLKGPSGTLFGANISSFGGVVNLVTKKPFETARTEIGYTTGSFNLNRISADVNLPLNEDKTALLRVNGVFSDKNSFLNYGFSSDYQVAPSLSYKLSDRLDVLLDAEFTASNRTLTPLLYVMPSSGFATPRDIPLEYNASLFGNDLDSKSNSTRLFTQINYRMGADWRSSTLVSFANQRVIRNHQPGITWYSPVEAARDVWIYGPITENYFNIQENINGEFVTGPFRHKFLAGVNFRKMSTQFQYAYVKDWGYIDTINVQVSPFPSVLTKSIVDPFIEVDNGYQAPSHATISAYASDVIGIADRVFAMLSLRVDRYRREGVPGQDGYGQTSLSPKLGLVYQVLKDRMSLFGNYMNGFQNQEPITQRSGGIFIPDPVYANQAEMGVKIETGQKKANLTLSWYRIAIANAIRYDAAYNAIQDGKQLSSGFEAEASLNPVPGLNVIAGYVYNHNRMVRASDETVIGKQVQGMPKNVANFWMNYTMQNTLKGLGFGFGGNFAGKAPYFSWTDYEIPSFTILNATAFFEQSKYRIGLKFNNLTNQKYWDLMGIPQLPFNVAGNITLRF